MGRVVEAWGGRRRRAERGKGRKGARPCSPALSDDGFVGGVSAGAAECGGGGLNGVGDPGDGDDYWPDFSTELVVSEVNTLSEVYKKRQFILTTTITHASQALAEVLELDINPDSLTTRRIGRVLGKMRLSKSRQVGTGKSGWMISLSDVDRWAGSHGLNITELTDLKIVTYDPNFTNHNNFTNHKAFTPLEAIL